jgi:small subunit ribosomal protein S2
MKDLLEAGVHFGHQRRKWNPKMKPYIYNERNGIHIIDLQQSAKKFQEAADFLISIASKGKKVLFVGTKKQAQDAIKEAATQCSMYYINRRWPGGLLTNFTSIRKSIDKYVNLLELRRSEKWEQLSKKEQSRLEKLIRRLEKLYIGIKDMDSLPDAIIVIDPKKEAIAVKEANIMKVPVVGVVDTNCDPTGVTYIVPGNDDAIRAVRMFTSKFAEAINEGLKLYRDQFPEEAPSVKLQEESLHEDVAKAISLSEDYEEDEEYE